MKGKNARKNFTLPQRPSAWSEAINDVRKRLGNIGAMVLGYGMH